MRKTLIGLTMLLAAACLAADDEPKPADAKAREKQPPGKADAVQRELESRMRELRAAEERQEGINQQIGEEKAEYKIKVATLEAEHKVKLAALEKELLRASAAADAIRRESGRIAGEMGRQRARAGGPFPPGGFGGAAGFGGAGGFGGAAGFGGIAGPGGFGGRGGPPRDVEKAEPQAAPEASRRQTTDQKLDAILTKLEQMESRLRRLESTERGRR
jgi:hypothetical protein